MAPRGGGPGGSRLLSILSFSVFDELFSVCTVTCHEMKIVLLKSNFKQLLVYGHLETKKEYCLV